MKLEIRHGSSFLYNHEDIVSFALKYTAKADGQGARTALRDHILYFDVSKPLHSGNREQTDQILDTKIVKGRVPHPIPIYFTSSRRLMRGFPSLFPV